MVEFELCRLCGQGRGHLFELGSIVQVVLGIDSGGGRRLHLLALVLEIGATT